MKQTAFTLLPLLMLAAFMLPSNKSCAPLMSTIQSDGPYVLYTGDSILVNYVLQEDTVKSVKQDIYKASQKDAVLLSVVTDEPGKTFQVKLKTKLEEEKAEYDKPDKMFVLSDIEGNFRAFRKLLQSHGVIDSAFHWTFGTGHLVLTGDFVDRGVQQTEVLWLIYSLEDQALVAGGKVHYVLGNHEIMNMNGDLRYLNKKYSENAVLLNRGYTSLVGDQSELGRWLRTKNVVERVGDILFCHGGISQPVNRMNLPLSNLNKMVRPYYADSLMQYDKPETDTLYSDLGPFWYRGYYYGAVKATPAQLDSTLSTYKVKQVATGHTVIADTISILRDGKLMNTDVHHAGGHIEALYIEKGNYYRATSLGEKFLVLSR